MNWKLWLKKVFIFLKKKSVYYIERIILEKSGSFLGLRVAVLLKCRFLQSNDWECQKRCFY
ncbi:protein of unknown function [Streptococcus thermophilus]|nr:protein of unknown function [Streptococcus thermophilus]CAD0143825.1 protein of unknown function [Streptococcus thermophilus]CAD0148274.1 protein of unknown function [Streptococcus thermophilus]CAD0149422.1 protein of unknown function [Streptococcus thermophilus]